MLIPVHLQINFEIPEDVVRAHNGNMSSLKAAIFDILEDGAHKWKEYAIGEIHSRILRHQRRIKTKELDATSASE